MHYQRELVQTLHERLAVCRTKVRDLGRKLTLTEERVMTRIEQHELS